jgi:hypothetical protein
MSIEKAEQEVLFSPRPHALGNQVHSERRGAEKLLQTARLKTAGFRPEEEDHIKHKDQRKDE